MWKDETHSIVEHEKIGEDAKEVLWDGRWKQFDRIIVPACSESHFELQKIAKLNFSKLIHNNLCVKKICFNFSVTVSRDYLEDLVIKKDGRFFPSNLGVKVPKTKISKLRREPSPSIFHRPASNDKGAPVSSR